MEGKVKDSALQSLESKYSWQLTSHRAPREQVHMAFAETFLPFEGNEQQHPKASYFTFAFLQCNKIVHVLIQVGD